jgi:hypothetical protein
MNPAFLALGAVVLTAAIAWLLYFRVFLPLSERERADAAARLGHRAKDGAADALPRNRSCPLCGAALSPGENVKTHLFPGEDRRMMRIFGCPNCYPPNQRRQRVCPVCRTIIPREGYAIASLFEKPGRKHVHVLGCSACRKGG